MPDSYVVTKINSLSGELYVGADKSISHRSIYFSSIIPGVNVITGLLQSHDIDASKALFKALGVSFTNRDNKTIVDSSNFIANNQNVIKLDMGNSGTTARLGIGLMSALVGQKFYITGDASLSRRPMARVSDILSANGANISLNNGCLPATIIGSNIKHIEYVQSVPSAQVKMAVLIAGLVSKNGASVLETVPTRDHGENMMEFMGINIQKRYDNNKYYVDVPPQDITKLNKKNIEIPRDFSSAVFFIVAALISKNSRIVLKSVNLNDSRIGLLKVLQSMGGSITISNVSTKCNEKIGDIVVCSSQLYGIKVPDHLIVSMIDEFPILCIAACFAKGQTSFKNISELKYKESNRIESMYSNLIAVGAEVKKLDDGLSINGNCDFTIKNMIKVFGYSDHRILMSFIIMGLRTGNITVDEITSIRTSYPDFLEHIKIIASI